MKSSSNKKADKGLERLKKKIESQDSIIKELKHQSKQLKLHKQLKESEEKFRSMFELNQVGIRISDISGKVIDCNKAMEKITGYTLKEFSKINITDTYFHKEEREKLVKLLKKNKKVENYEVQLLKKNGTPYWGELSINFIKLNNRDVFLTTCIDITHRKKDEQLFFKKEVMLKEV